MKIDRLETINLRFEYSDVDRFRYAGGECTARVTSLVLVHTDTGHVGIGSAYSHPALVYLIVKHQLEPLLRGEDPREVEALWKMMYRVTRWYGRKGAAMSALGAVDTALWDLRGKSLGKPIWALLGGQSGGCDAYASALLWKDPDGLAEEAAGLIAKGFRRVKMRLGRNEQFDTAAVAAVRRAIGDDNDLMVDASMRYHVELARRIGRVLKENRVFWFEEPFAPDDIDSFVALRGTTGVKLAAGENEFGFEGFRELIRAGALDIVQPDASRAGGISEVWRTGQLAGEAGLQVATHTWCDAVAVVANAHVVSALPNGLTVEVDQTGNPFIDTLLVEPLRVIDGTLTLGDAPGLEAPGLGIELNDSVVDRFRMDDPLTIPEGNYSDMVFGKQHLTPASPYEESG